VSTFRIAESWADETLNCRVLAAGSPKNFTPNYRVYTYNALFLFELPRDFQGAGRLLRIIESFESSKVWIIESRLKTG